MKMEFNRRFPWENKVHLFRTNMDYAEIKIHSKTYKLLKEIEYYNHGKWIPYASAFSVDNSRIHRGYFTAFLIMNKENELEILTLKGKKQSEKLMLETQRKAIRTAICTL